jgi:hypothetical protein
VWGRNDPYFLPAGAKAFKRDIPNAEIHLLDTGHFALETHCAEIATMIGTFLDRNLLVAENRGLIERQFRSEGQGAAGDLDSASSKSGEHVCVYCY